MENQFSFGGLLKHCRNIIRKGSFIGGRISRGEYLISYLIISLLGSTAGTVLRQLGGEIGLQVSGLISIILGVFGIKLITKRAHDLGKSGRFYFIPLFCLIGLLIIAAIYIVSQGLFSLGEGNPGLNISAVPISLLRTFAIAFAAATIWVLVTICMIIFKRGAKDTNAYGPDPLLHQPSSSSNYWVLGVCILALSIIIGSFGQPQPSNLKLNPQEMRGSDSETNTIQNLGAPEDYDSSAMNDANATNDPQDTATSSDLPEDY